MIEREKTLLILLCIAIIIFAVALIFTIDVNQKNKEKFSKPKPVDGTQITSNDVNGNVESIHTWGRTEIVPIKGIELEYYEFIDTWQMDGDVVQPTGRNGYFMPVMKGHLDLNVRELTQTWVEHEILGTGPVENPEVFEDFRVADIHVKNGKIIDIKYSHYRLLSDKTWSVIASWKANFNPDIPDPVPENVTKDDVPLIVCSFCKGKGETLTDVNKLMMDASLAIFFNHHLSVDKCEKCVKLPNGDGYNYCDVVNERYQTLLKEYDAVGPKMDMAACEQCMGEGTFSSKDLTTGKWLTQEEYDEKHKKD